MQERSGWEVDRLGSSQEVRIFSARCLGVPWPRHAPCSEEARRLRGPDAAGNRIRVWTGDGGTTGASTFYEAPVVPRQKLGARRSGADLSRGGEVRIWLRSEEPPQRAPARLCSGDQSVAHRDLDGVHILAMPDDGQNWIGEVVNAASGSSAPGILFPFPCLSLAASRKDVVLLRGTHLAPVPW